MKLAPTTTARLAVDVAAMIALLSANVRSVCTCGRPAPRGRVEFVSHEHAVAAPLDAPATDGVERGRLDGFARAQTETGVVPRTMHGLADDQSVSEWSVVMGALCADREELVLARDH